MKKTVTKTLLGVSAFALAATVWCSPAAATSFSIVGVEDADLTASVNFLYDAGVIDVDITNDSPYDARLTAFAFNAPGAVTGISSFTASSTGWIDLFYPDQIDTPDQFGLFDIAGYTGNVNENNPNINGGDPNDGIPTGETFSFQFVLEGLGLDGLTADSFLSLNSANEPGQTDPQWFIGRFQRTGIFGEGSDVAIPNGGNGAPPVPEPATMLLVGTGLGLAGLRKKMAAK